MRIEEMPKLKMLSKKAFRGNSGGSRIFLSENCMKMKEFGPRVGRVPGVPLDPPMGSVSPIFCPFFHFHTFFRKDRLKNRLTQIIWKILDPPLESVSKIVQNR